MASNSFELSKEEVGRLGLFSLFPVAVSKHHAICVEATASLPEFVKAAGVEWESIYYADIPNIGRISATAFFIPEMLPECVRAITRANDFAFFYDGKRVHFDS